MLLAKKIERENKKKRELQKKKKLSVIEDQTKPQVKKNSVTQDDDGIEHLDTWA